MVSSIRHFAAATGVAMLASLITGTTGVAAAATGNDCPISDVEYAVNASVLVKDTPFGAANGIYPLGSGRMRLRIDGEHGQQSVKMMSYDVSNRMTVEAKVAMLSTKVVTTSRTSTARDTCDGSAQGTLHDGTLTWNSKVAGYRSDGTMECSGSMCGKFGAPPKGTSPFHDAPPSITWNAFSFSSDLSSFSMPYTLVSKSDSPSQTTYLTLTGHRVSESCSVAAALACGGRLASKE